MSLFHLKNAQRGFAFYFNFGVLPCIETEVETLQFREYGFFGEVRKFT